MTTSLELSRVQKFLFLFFSTESLAFHSMFYTIIINIFWKFGVFPSFCRPYHFTLCLILFSQNRIPFVTFCTMNKRLPTSERGVITFPSKTRVLWFSSSPCHFNSALWFCSDEKTGTCVVAKRIIQENRRQSERVKERERGCKNKDQRRENERCCPRMTKSAIDLCDEHTLASFTWQPTWKRKRQREKNERVILLLPVIWMFILFPPPLLLLLHPLYFFIKKVSWNVCVTWSDTRREYNWMKGSDWSENEEERTKMKTFVAHPSFFFSCASCSIFLLLSFLFFLFLPKSLLVRSFAQPPPSLNQSMYQRSNVNLYQKLVTCSWSLFRFLPSLLPSFSSFLSFSLMCYWQKQQFTLSIQSCYVPYSVQLHFTISLSFLLQSRSLLLIQLDRPSTHSIYDRRSILVSKWALFLPQLLISLISSSFLVMWSFFWITVMNRCELKFDRQRGSDSRNEDRSLNGSNFDLLMREVTSMFNTFFPSMFSIFSTSFGWPNYYTEIKWVTSNLMDSLIHYRHGLNEIIRNSPIQFHSTAQHLLASNPIFKMQSF